MKLLVPAVWYRARAILERRWGWSPVEEAVLLELRARPGTSSTVASGLGLPRQVVEAAIGRLMRFGLIEIRGGPAPTLAMTDAAQKHVRRGRALPERVARREIAVSLVFDKLGGSIFRRRDVAIRPVRRASRHDIVVAFPEGDPEESDASMEVRLRDLLARLKRTGEVFAMVRSGHSVIEKQYLEIDLARARDGVLPSGTTDALAAAVRDHLKSGRVPTAPPSKPKRPICMGAAIRTKLVPDQIVLGGGDHFARCEAMIDAAANDVFVLSTFVGPPDDPKPNSRQPNIRAALARAADRGVKVHLFFGSSLDTDGKHSRAMIALNDQIGGRVKGIAAHHDPAQSHAKFLIADDGSGGARALVGSCNWLQSPLLAHELSIELRDGPSVAACLELFFTITATVPTARSSRDAMQAMRATLNLGLPGLMNEEPTNDAIAVNLRFLAATDHFQLLRRAAHDAKARLVVMTHKMGAPMNQNVFDPAEVAAERIERVQALYSVPAGPTKNSDIRAARARSGERIDLKKIQSKKAVLHGKGLYWDNDDIVVTSLNWGSQTASEAKPLDEIGLHLHGTGVAEVLDRAIGQRLFGTRDDKPRRSKQ